MHIRTGKASGKSWHLIHLALPFVLVGTLVFATVLAASPSDRTVWTVKDIVDERIATDGQYSLIRMCRRLDPDATSLLAAVVDDDSLAGIYQVNFGVPAKRAQALGTTWWELIPKGEDGACVAGFTSGGDEAPMIVYRKDIGSYPERVDAALKSAWRTCSAEYSLPRLPAIPCVIPKRQAADLSACPEEEQEAHMRIFDECTAQRGLEAAFARCAQECGQKAETESAMTVTMTNDCIDSSPECQSFDQITETCSEYADKQISCP